MRKNKNNQKSNLHQPHEIADIKFPSNHKPKHVHRLVNKKSKKILVTMLVILTLIIILSVYYWLIINTQNYPYINTNFNDSLSPNNKTVNSDKETEAIINNTQTLSPSDEIPSIISDLESTSNLNDIENDVNKIDVIINED